MRCRCMGQPLKYYKRFAVYSPYPMAAVAAGAQGPRARRASVQMGVMEALPGSSTAGNHVLTQYKQ